MSAARSEPTIFGLEEIGGPWGRRLARRRAGLAALPWAEAAEGTSEPAREAARQVWTQSAFSEVASAAAFADIASRLLAAGAPIDLVAAAGDFVVDEVIHAELSARAAMAFGGAVALQVDLTRLVRPATGQSALLRAAEAIVRSSCVGEALTVPLLKVARTHARTAVLREVLGRIVRDESAHAQLGVWFLDWAGARLTDADLAHLGQVAGGAVRAFAPLFGRACSAEPADGVLGCSTYDPAFAAALERRVVRPLAARGIAIPREDLAALTAC